MELSQMLFGTFKNKYNRGAILVDVFYEDPYFSNVYNQMCNGIEDKSQYIQVLNQNQSILEIGSGSGRILQFLIEQGFNVHGVEPSGEMLKFIQPIYRKQIFQMGIEDIRRLGTAVYDCIIIPATTVSLFDFETFEIFLEDASYLLKEEGEIIFDFWDETYVEQLNDCIQKVEIDGNLVFYSNFIRKEQLIFNMYVKINEKGKLGFSQKYIYTEAYLQGICRKYKFFYTLLEVKNNCKMVRLKK